VDDTLKITCPCCKTILIVDRRKGAILEERRPILEDSTGDRFEDAFLKVRRSKEVAEAKFTEAQRKERERKAKIESLFNEELKRIKESGDTSRPKRDIDLD